MIHVSEICVPTISVKITWDTLSENGFSSLPKKPEKLALLLLVQCFIHWAIRPIGELIFFILRFMIKCDKEGPSYHMLHQD